MTSKRILRCAVYTRKSTDHGLELEFNSLAAQREACEAYIKSQSNEGWTLVRDPYDDPAYSGGNLDRPALQQLLKDIDAGHIDVVVVYKIDRLTRSLADFAKLVEAFDARSISFVAVTQQFNTTTSMGRLTLNVLLSFAQFERELSSERVRDKVAASRRRGKWMGGSVALGYDAKDKKLVINPGEANTIRTIFQRYLELGTLQKLLADLRDKRIVTKRRVGPGGRIAGGIPFGPGALAHLLKNRVYVGDTGHGESWFKGEHEAILDPAVFEQVQAKLKSNAIKRNLARSDSDAMLAGLVFDDRGNRMSPSYSTKNGIRYRFYVNRALLEGRQAEAGSVMRIAAPQVEQASIAAIRPYVSKADQDDVNLSDRHLIEQYVDRVIVERNNLRIRLKHGLAVKLGCDSDAGQLHNRTPSDQHPREITAILEVSKRSSAKIEGDNTTANNKTDPVLAQAITRAHSWVRAIEAGTYTSIEQLATSVNLHAKVVRNTIKLAFLAPDITAAVLEGQNSTNTSLSDLQKSLTINWDEQRKLVSAAIN